MSYASLRLINLVALPGSLGQHNDFDQNGLPVDNYATTVYKKVSLKSSLLWMFDEEDAC